MIYQNFLENHHAMLCGKLTSLTRSKRKKPRGERKPIKTTVITRETVAEIREMCLGIRKLKNFEPVGLFIYYSNRSKKHVTN